MNNPYIIPDTRLLDFMDSQKLVDSHLTSCSGTLLYITQTAALLESGLQVESRMGSIGSSHGLAVSLVLAAACDRDSFIALSWYRVIYAPF